jgi:hypothetical protein
VTAHRILGIDLVTTAGEVVVAEPNLDHSGGAGR